MALAVESESAERPTNADSADGRYVDVALVNTLLDAALVHTENQFGRLLAATGGDDVQVRPRHYTLPGLPRREASAQRIRERYCPIEALLDAAPSGLP